MLLMGHGHKEENGSACVSGDFGGKFVLHRRLKPDGVHRQRVVDPKIAPIRR